MMKFDLAITTSSKYRHLEVEMFLPFLVLVSKYDTKLNPACLVIAAHNSNESAHGSDRNVIK